MMMTNDQSEEELLQKFKQACIDHYRGTESGDHELTNRAADQINGVVEELWEQNGKTKEGLRKLSELAQDQDPRIAGKAAAYTINLFPEVSTVLKHLKKDKSIIGLQAKYALKNWEEGGGIMKTLLNLE